MLRYVILGVKDGDGDQYIVQEKELFDRSMSIFNIFIFENAHKGSSLEIHYYNGNKSGKPKRAGKRLEGVHL